MSEFSRADETISISIKYAERFKHFFIGGRVLYSFRHHCEEFFETYRASTCGWNNILTAMISAVLKYILALRL